MARGIHFMRDDFAFADIADVTRTAQCRAFRRIPKVPQSPVAFFYLARVLAPRGLRLFQVLVYPFSMGSVARHARHSTLNAERFLESLEIDQLLILILDVHPMAT